MPVQQEIDPSGRQETKGSANERPIRHAHVWRPVESALAPESKEQSTDLVTKEARRRGEEDGGRYRPTPDSRSRRSLRSNSSMRNSRILAHNRQQQASKIQHAPV